MNTTGNTSLKVNFPTDENGLTGRECPLCERYFKIKFGTGAKTAQCICPYCGHTDNHQKFFTKDQVDYVKSIITTKIVGPIVNDFAQSISQAKTSPNSLIQLKISVDLPTFQIKYYQEKILETNITCDNCGLIFAIYGVFSNCPDCGKLNARVIFERSLEGSKKKIQLADDETLDEHIRNDLIKDALVGSVAAFDSFGKALRQKYPNLPSRPKNLFQNFTALDETLSTVTGKSINHFLTQVDSDFLFLMFQVRHLFEHNAGVIDNDFVSKLPTYTNNLGHKYELKKEDVLKFISLMSTLASQIYNEFEN